MWLYGAVGTCMVFTFSYTFGKLYFFFLRPVTMTKQPNYLKLGIFYGCRSARKDAEAPGKTSSRRQQQQKRENAQNSKIPK